MFLEFWAFFLSTMHSELSAKSETWQGLSSEEIWNTNRQQINYNVPSVSKLKSDFAIENKISPIFA